MSNEPNEMIRAGIQKRAGNLDAEELLKDLIAFSFISL
tara:strand:- start:177 stop:290 length:114 start_codon:yes stop_codon:yes gene_type:complete